MTRQRMTAAEMVRTGLVFGVGLLFAAGCDKQQTTAQAPDDSNLAPPVVDVSAPAVASDAEVVNVDGAIMTEADLDAEVQQVIAQRRMGDVPPPQRAHVKKMLRSQIIERFVSQHLLINEADRQKIEVSAADTSNAVAEVVAGLPEGVSLEQILSTSGISDEKFKADLVNNLKVRKLMESRDKEPSEPTEKAVLDFYTSEQQHFKVPESVHARHVLFQCEKDADEAARAEKKKQAEEVQALLAGGADFAETAKSRSDCPSKSEGGDLGTFTRGRMVKAFEDAAFSQAVSNIGPVVESPFGYHIIQVLSHEQEGVRPFDEVKEDIASFLQNRTRQEAATKYVEELRLAANIKYASPPAADRPPPAPAPGE